MSTDDELRRRLSNAADRAGAGANPAAATQAVAAKAAQGGHMALRLLGGLGAAGLVAGGLLGLTVLKPSASGPSLVSGAEITGLGLAGFDCPNGAVVASLNAGDRVFAIGRNDDSSWLAIRNPQHTDHTVWVPAKAARRDATSDLPVTPCDATVPTGLQPTDTGSTSTTTTVAETTTTTTTATTVAPPTSTKVTVPKTVPPTTPPTTTPPTTPDKVPPKINLAFPVKTDIAQVYGANSNTPACPKTLILRIGATDNVGVATVVGSWQSGLIKGTVNFSPAGAEWHGTYGPVNVTTSFPNTTILINVTVKDAAGNAATTTLQLSLAGQCIG